MFDEQDRQYFYNEFKNNGYEVGTYDDFKKDLNNKEDRDWYYNEAKNMGYDVGTLEDFDKMVLEPAPSTSGGAQQVAASTTPQSASTETKPQVAQPAAKPAAEKPKEDNRSWFTKWMTGSLPEEEKPETADKEPGLIAKALGMIPTGVQTSNGTYQPSPEIPQPVVKGEEKPVKEEASPSSSANAASPEYKEEVPVTTPTGVVNNEGLMDAKLANYLENWKQRPDKQGTYFENMVADLLADGTANSNEEAVSIVKSALGRYANRSAMDVTNQVVSSLPDDTVQDAEKSIEAQWYSHVVQDKLKQEADNMGISYDEYVGLFLKPAMVQSLVNKYGPNYRNIAEGIATRLYAHDEHVQDRLMNQDINDALSSVISKYVNPSVVDEYNKAQEAGSKAFTEGMEGSQFIPANLRLGTALGAQYEANEAKDPAKVLSTLQNKFGKLYRNPKFLNDMSNAAFKVMQRYGLNGTLSSDPKQFKPMINSVLKNELDQLEIKGMMPKGSAEYIMKTGLGNTIVGKITRKAVQTDYQNWLEDIANQQYQPGFWENVASGALTFAGDAWSYWLPGAAGGKLTKSMIAKAEGKLAGDLMAKGMESRMAARAAKLLIGKSKTEALKSGAVHGAVTFGGQSAISKPIDEKYRTGQFDENGKIYNPSGWKIALDTLLEGGKQSALGVIMQGNTIANMIGKGRGLATNILADVGGKVVDSGIMTGHQMLERMAKDPNFKPTGKDAAESFLESMANLTAIGLPGMVGKYARFKDTREFNKKFDFTDQDIAELKRFGYDGLRDAFEKVGIGEYAVEGENAQRLDGQLTQKYMNLMNDKSVPEVLKAKMMAVVEGKRPSSFSPVVDSVIVQPMDNGGKVYLETLNKDGGIIDRKEYSSLDEAQKADKKLEYEKTLGLASVLEGEFHNEFTQEHLDGLYNQAAQKYNMGEKLTDEDKAAVYLHQNAGAIKEIMDKQQKGIILTEEEQKLVDTYRHFYNSALENSSVMREFVNTFEDSHGVARGTLRKALESKDKKYAPLVESYLKELYNSIELKREMKQTVDDLYNTAHGNEQKRIEQSGIEGEKPAAPVEGAASVEGAAPVEGTSSVEGTAGGQEPPVSAGPAPYQDSTNSVPSPSDANSAANVANSDAFVMGQEAYKNGDSDTLKAIDYNSDLATGRLKRAFADSDTMFDLVTKAYNEGRDMEQFVAQRAGNLTPAQKEAISKYVEAMDAKNGAIDALQHADDGYGEALKEQLWPYQTEDGNIVPATLTSGKQVFLKKANEYGGGFVVVPDEQGQPTIKQVSNAEIKEVGTPVSLDEYIESSLAQQKEARNKQFISQFDGSGLKPNDRVTVAMEEGDANIDMTFAGYSEDGKIVLTDGKDYLPLSKEEFAAWRTNALNNTINERLDREDDEREQKAVSQAEADKKQRYANGIVGLSEGQPDYSSKDTDAKVAAEYLQEQYGEDHGKLLNLVNGSRDDIKTQLDNKKKAAAEYQNWLDTNADLDPEKAKKVEGELSLVNEQIADLDARFKNWNTIRNSVMTPDEVKAMTEERKAEVEKAGVDETAIVPSDDFHLLVLDDKELKKQYPTMDKASDYITSQRKDIYHTQEDVEHKLNDVNDMLEQYINGETELDHTQLMELNTTKAQLEAQQTNLSVAAKGLKAQANKLSKLYKTEVSQQEMEELGMTPSEQRKVLVSDAIKKNDLGAIKEIYKDASVDVTDLTPQTLEEAVSESLSPHSLNPESLQYELGKSNFKFGIGKGYDSNKFNYLIAKKGTGMSVNEFAVRVYNDLPVNLQDMGYTDQDVRNALLDMFKSYDSVKEMRNVALMNRIAAAEDELSSEEEYYEAQKEREIIERQAEIEKYKSFIHEKELSLPSESELDHIYGLEYDRMMEIEDREREYKQYVKSILPELADYDDRSNDKGYGGGSSLGSDSSRRGVDEGNSQGEEVGNGEASSESEIGEGSDSGRKGRQETGSLERGEGSAVRGSHLPQEASFGERLKSAIAETEPNPSEAQKKAGNYKKGHLSFGGYDYTVETPKGVTRSGKDEQGKPWSVTMHDTYGYILGKIGVDGDHIDMFINDAADLDTFDGNVYVVDQVNPETGEFDEHKVMYGYPDEAAATKAYLSNYSKGWKGLGKVSSVPKATFDKWLESSDRKTKPFAEYAMIKKDSNALSRGQKYPKGFEAIVNPNMTPELQKAAMDYSNALSRGQKDENLPFDAPMNMDDLPFHRDVKEVKPSDMTEAQKVAFDAVSTMLKKAGIPVKVVSNEDMEKVAEAQDNLNLAMLLNQPEMRFKIKTPEEKQAAENAYNFAKDLRPNKWAQYAVVDMSNPNKMPEYYQKQELARKERTYLNRLMWGNYKVFNLDKSFEDNVAGLTGSFPSEFDPYKIDAQTNKKNELKKQIKETEEAYKLTGQERKEYQNQLMKEYMDEHGLASENDIPDDVWREFDYKAIEKYQDKLDSLFAKYKDLDRQLKAIVQPGVEYLKGKGVVYGYTDGKEIVLNQEHLNPNTPIHEYQHLWRTAAKEMNPELIAHGDELIKQTQLFADLKEDENYKHLSDDEICDEAFARLTGEDGAAILEQMAKDAIKENPLDTAKELTIINRLKNWLKKFWYWTLDTFTKWKPEDIKKMTLEDIRNLVLRDLAQGVDPRNVKSRMTKEDAVSLRKQMEESVEDKIKAVSQQFGVDEADVAMYANAVKKGSTAEAARARANIKRHLLQANEDKISSFKDIIKYTKPINEALKENFGDLDAMIEERVKQVEAQRNAMEAARKRAEEEEAKRQKHLEELSLIPDDQLDKQYMDALAKGDDATAREMLDEAARRKGYDDTESAYQGVGAWAAPGNPGYESDKARRDDWESSGSDVNLEDIALGYAPQPDDYFSHPERYSQNTPHGLESVKAINTAIDAIKNGEKDVKVKVYRAVPTSVKEGKLRNGDWVTPSKKYAEMHGTNRLDGKYRIIEDEVPATQLWWDGNDANEFGFDDGKEYKYKNAKNNRKLNDLVTYDDEGDVIPPSKRFNSRKQDVRFHRVTEPEELDRLNKEKTFRMYSGMQEVDGKLYSPMAAIIDGKRTDATEIGAWMRADERPDLVKNGKFQLVKTDKKPGAGEGPVRAAYNPYMHTSTSMMNDQFTGAYARGNIKVVEWEIPESEKTSGYRAEGAKDAVGLVPWHSGSVNGLLPKDRQRSVMLSRWRKAVRVVPDSEVAESIAEQLDGTGLAIPWNVVTPNQLRELVKLGVPITTVESGQQAPETKEKFMAQMEELKKEFPQAQFVNVKMTKDAFKEWGGKNNVKLSLGDTVPFVREQRSINNAFNDALDKQIAGTLPKGYNYQLGKPSSALKFAGIEDLPIELSSRTLEVKSSKDYKSNHPFDLNSVKNLPVAIQRPVAIFDSEYEDGRKVILTELKDGKGHSIIAVLGLRKLRGRNYAEVNSIISLYGKDSSVRIANWFDSKNPNGLGLDKNLCRWADTKKASEWLTNNASNVHSVGLSLKRIAKVINSFENNQFSEENLLLKHNFGDILGNSEGIAIENMRKVADSVVNTANKLGGAEATIYSSLDDVPEEYRPEVEQGAKGWYDPETHSVHVYLPNCEDGNDAQRTVLHEKIGHEGMEVLLGGEDEVRKFANFVYNSVAASTRGKILEIANEYDPDWKKHDRMNVGTQEYIARLAEEGPKTAEDFSLWTKIKHYLIKVLKKLGIRVPGLLNDKDLRYYLMKAGRALHVWDNMPKEKQKAMMKQASNAEIKDSLGEGAKNGKPRQKKGESMIQYMKRVQEWRKWKNAREDENDPEPPMFYDIDKDEAGKKEWARLNKDWRERHHLAGEEPTGLPIRMEGEEDGAYMTRIHEYEKWKDAMKDQEDPMPDMFAFEKKKQEEVKRKYEDWLARHELLEQQQADLDLYEGKIYPAETNPKADDLEQQVMQDLAEVTSTDVSKEGAAKTVKHAVIHRRKNMEEASADDAIYINDVKNRIEKMADSGAFDKLLSDYQGKPNRAEKLAEAIPYIMEAPRRLRDLAHDLNATGAFDKGHIHIQPADVEAIQPYVADLIAETGKKHTELRDDKEVEVYDDPQAVSDVASKMAQVINDNHQGEEGFVPIDGTDILSEHVLPLVKQQIVPEGIDYKNLSPEMKAAIDSIRDWYNYTYDWLKDNRTLKEDTGYNVDYVNHIWDKEKSDKQAYALYVENRQRTKSPNEKKRTISTLMEGISVGLVPKTTDITKMMAYYSRSNIEAWVNKTMLQELSGLNVIERNEDGEVVSTDPLLSSSAPFNLEQYKYFEIPGVGPVWVYNVSPKQVKVKNPITGKEKVLYSEASAGDRFGVVFETYQSSPFWKAFDTLASSAKKLELGFSGFHAGALTEVYMVQNMAEFGPKKAMAYFMKYIFVDTMKNHQLPCFANPEDFQEAASHLVKFGATNDYAAADVQNMFDNLRDFAQKLQKKLEERGNIGTAAGAATIPFEIATQMVSMLNKGMDVALWDFIHDGLKLASYRMRADRTKERAKKYGWTDEQLSKALDEDGQFVNDMFGGQHWDILGVSQRTFKIAGRALLSPDWNVSTTRHFMAMTGFGSVWNEATFEDFKNYYNHVWAAARGKEPIPPEYFGRKQRQISALICYFIGFLFYEAFANAHNAAFRALDEEKERKKAEEIRKTNPNYKSMYELAYPDGMKWYDYLMRGNSLGQQSKIFMGRYEDGTEMYIRHGKQFREVPEYLFNHKGELEFPGPMVQRMIGKANPMVRMALDDINYLSDFQASHADQEIQRKYGKTIGLLYKDALYWAPFLIPSQENKEFKAVDFFFPSSKGFSPWKAQSYFKDFILSGDMEGVVMTYQSCQRNGIDAEAQIKAAIGSVKALESAEMNDGVTSLQVACQRFDAAKSITEKKKMRQKMKKFLSQSDYKAFTQKEALDMVQGYLNGDEDLKEMEKAESKYLMAAKAEDVTEDWRIQNVWNGTMETYQEYQRLKDIDKAKANAFKNSKTNKRLFAARKAISAAKKKMNKAKKQMDGTNGAAKMVEIRKTRKELLNTLNGME